MKNREAEADFESTMHGGEAKTIAVELHALSRAPGRFRPLSRPAIRGLVYLAGDLAALVLAHAAAIHLVQHLLEVPLEYLNPVQYHRYHIVLFALMLYLFDGYRNPEMRRPERELELGCKAVAFVFLALTLFNFVVFKEQPLSRYLVATWFALACVFLIVVRFTLRAANERLWMAGVGRKKTILLGSPARLSEYLELLNIQRYHGCEILSWINEEAHPTGAVAGSLCLPMAGTLDDWEKAVSRANADLLVVAASAFPDGDARLAQILRRCRDLHVDAEVYSSVLAAPDLHFERDEFSGCVRFYGRPPWSLALQRIMKRALDLQIGLLGGLCTVLIAPIIAILIKLQDGGPVFYRSAYLGQDGRIHYYLKFRTMRVDADEILARDAELRSRFQVRQKLENDPRVTTVGRFLRRSSLDEFPQFFDVLLGYLSFVGPRTIRKEEAVHYGPLLSKLLSVKPGLTGFWQAMGRQSTSYEERVRMDMFYLDRWSIWLDLVIIAKTFWKVLRAEGAH